MQSPSHNPVPRLRSLCSKNEQRTRLDATGIEIAPDWKPVPWWEPKGSYSVLQIAARDKAGFTDNLNTGSDNGSSPHQVEFQHLFNLRKKIEVDATYRYVSALSAQGREGISDR
jgi:hypothetical protein